ncbi:MAG: hypothetical protein KDA28_06465, partial [Phycisphaerales bacterium]|nr:hypothetical protein [Phycisphaerales bacterium]
MSDLERRRLLLALWDHDRWQSSWMSDHLLESFEQTPAMHEAMVTPLLERWSDPSQRWTERDAAALQMLDQRGWLTDDERQEIRDGLTRPVLVVDDGTPIAPGDMVGLWFRQDVRSAMLDRARFRMPPEFMICGFGMARAMHRPYDGDVLDAVYALDFHEARPHVTIRARSIERQTPGGDMNVSLAAAMIDRVGAWAIDRVVMPTLHDGPSVSGLPEFLSRDVAHMVVPSGLPEVVGGNDLRLGLRVRLPEIADRVLIRIDVLSNGERHAVTRLTYDRSKTAGLLAGHESIEIDESGFRVQGRRVGLRLLTSGLDVDRLDVHATITHVEQLGTTWTIEHTRRFEDLDVVHLDR